MINTCDANQRRTPRCPTFYKKLTSLTKQSSPLTWRSPAAQLTGILPNMLAPLVYPKLPSGCGSNSIVFWGYIGIMEKKMETTIVFWGYIGMMFGFQGYGIFSEIRHLFGLEGHGTMLPIKEISLLVCWFPCKSSIFFMTNRSLSRPNGRIYHRGLWYHIL